MTSSGFLLNQTIVFAVELISPRMEEQPAPEL
jgi:hypothetical protein